MEATGVLALPQGVKLLYQTRTGGGEWHDIIEPSPLRRRGQLDQLRAPQMAQAARRPP